MNSEWMFRGAVVLSLLVHGLLLAMRTDGGKHVVERIIRIPVILEEPPPPPPSPPPSPPPPSPKPQRQRRPDMNRRISEVVEGDGLRSGELVDAEIGEYSDAIASLPPPPPPPPPPPKPRVEKPSVDRAALAREYLTRLRGELNMTRRYPISAQRMGVTGRVTVAFVVQRDGTFSDITVRASSGHDILDRAALSTVEALSGRFSRPAELGDMQLKTSVILRFEIDR